MKFSLVRWVYNYEIRDHVRLLHMIVARAPTKLLHSGRTLLRRSEAKYSLSCKLPMNVLNSKLQGATCFFSFFEYHIIDVDHNLHTYIVSAIYEKALDH